MSSDRDQPFAPPQQRFEQRGGRVARHHGKRVHDLLISRVRGAQVLAILQRLLLHHYSALPFTACLYPRHHAVGDEHMGGRKR